MTYHWQVRWDLVANFVWVSLPVLLLIARAFLRHHTRTRLEVALQVERPSGIKISVAFAPSEHARFDLELRGLVLAHPLDTYAALSDDVDHELHRLDKEGFVVSKAHGVLKIAHRPSPRRKMNNIISALQYLIECAFDVIALATAESERRARAEAKRCEQMLERMHALNDDLGLKALERMRNASDPVVRGRCIRVLAALPSTDNSRFVAIEEALHDPDPRLVVQVATYAGPKAVEPLRRVIAASSTPDAVAAHAVIALVRLGYSPQALVRCALDKGPATSLSLVQLLATFPPDAATQDAMLELAAHPEPQVQMIAIRWAGSCASTAALDVLRQIQEPSDVLRAATTAIDAIVARFASERAGQLSIETAVPSGALSVPSAGHISLFKVV